MTEELYQFLACDYYATGEGRTVCLLITRAYPTVDDHPDNTPAVSAALEFASEFDSFYLQGAENLTREEFLKRFGHHLPDYVHNILNAGVGEIPGNFNFKQTLHLNFS